MRKPPTDASRSQTAGPLRALTTLVCGLAATMTLLWNRGLDGATDLLVARGARNLAEDRARGLVTDDRELGNVITDNLGMIVFGILAIVVIGAAISNLGASVVSWVTKQLGV